jgi:hypothetical protein
MQAALVEPLPFADREQIQVVVVVGNERQLSVDGLAVDGEAEVFAAPGEEDERAQLRECVAPAAMAFAVMDELRVEPERDVVQEQAFADAADVDPPLESPKCVQRGDWIVAVEPEVASEVVSRSEGNADEGNVALDCDLCDCGERTVTTGGAERVRVGMTGEFCDVVSRLEDPRLDPAARCLLAELLRARASAARARVDQKQV